MIPLVSLGLLVWLVDRWRGRSRELNAPRITRTTVTFCLIAIVFAIVRNTPVGAWLAP